jgi:hypothetical protein
MEDVEVETLAQVRNCFDGSRAGRMGGAPPFLVGAGELRGL